MIARKILFSSFIFVTLWTLSPVSARAGGVSEYREKVGKVYDSLDYLNYPEESLSEQASIFSERERIRQIRAMLPIGEKIELPEGSFETDNRWLHNGLQNFEREQRDSPNRSKIIAELSDKLAALEARLIAVEKQAAAPKTKDEYRKKLSEILRKPEYQKPEKKKENVIQRMWSSFWEWLRDIFPRPELNKSETQNQMPPIAPFLQFLVIAAALGIIAFLLYRFAPVLLGNFHKRDRSKKEKRVILGETLAADETPENLFNEAENLARGGDLRGAIRKGYIALLCELSDRKMIGLARHKTNRDYLRDVRPRRNLHENMRVLTDVYERHWYGFDGAENQDWEEFRRRYKKTFSNPV